MGYFNNLSSIDGKMHIFSIFITVTILALFEVIFFFTNIVPNINDGLNTKLDSLTDIINSGTQDEKYNNIVKLLKIYTNFIPDDLYKKTDNEIDIVLKVLVEREQEIINEINIGTMITGGSILLFLICIILFTYINIKGRLGKGQSYKFTEPVLISIITVLLLIAFQTTFYFFSQNYEYPGNNEALSTIINNLKNN